MTRRGAAGWAQLTRGDEATILAMLGIARIEAECEYDARFEFPLAKAIRWVRIGLDPRPEPDWDPAAGFPMSDGQSAADYVASLADALADDEPRDGARPAEILRATTLSAVHDLFAALSDQVRAWCAATDATLPTLSLSGPLRAPDGLLHGRVWALTGKCEELEDTRRISWALLPHRLRWRAAEPCFEPGRTCSESQPARVCSIAALPYVFAHELLCHAAEGYFQTDSASAFVEGWVDFAAEVLVTDFPVRWWLPYQYSADSIRPLAEVRSCHTTDGPSRQRTKGREAARLFRSMLWTDFGDYLRNDANEAMLGMLLSLHTSKTEGARKNLIASRLSRARPGLSLGARNVLGEHLLPAMRDWVDALADVRHTSRKADAGPFLPHRTPALATAARAMERALLTL